MKKTRVWLMAILLILQCCIMGCAQSDNGKDDAAGEVSSITTTCACPDNGEVSTITTAAQTMVNATTSNTTSASRFTVRTNVKGKFTIVKNATEMLDWIQSDDFADCTFKQSVRQLKLEHVLSVQSSNEEFALEHIEIYHNRTNIDFHFVNRNNEEINWSVELPTENMTENYLKTRAEVINQAIQKKYPTKKGPMLYAADDVYLLGKSRQTYVREYGYAAQGCIHEPVHALFVTDIDGFVLECSLGGNLSRNNWDNAYLNHFKFSYRDIIMPTTTNAATITTAMPALKDLTGGN